MRTTAPFIVFAALILSSALSACGNSVSTDIAPVTTPPNVVAEKAKAHYFDQVITSFDGTLIAATVYVPALAAGETAPLILHGNGWADRRTRAPVEITRDPNNFYGDMHHGMVTRMWNEGYVVVTIDQRGWGDSGGQVRIMDPDKEIRDFSAVIDWAQAHLPAQKDSKGALVGAVGGSYGGGFQILLAAQDPRVRAISPWVSWHDLRYSLAPDQVMRTGHVSLLHAAGVAFARMDPFVNRAYLQGISSNTIPADVLDTLKHHSPIELCEAGRAPAIDALIVQGTRDTLFDASEGIANAQCLKAAGADVRFIAVPNGHIFNQQNIQRNPSSSRCGTIDPFEAVVAWYAEKLKGIPGAAAQIPDVCFPLEDDTRQFTAKEMPIGGQSFMVPPTQIVWRGDNVYNEGMTFIPLLSSSPARSALAGLPLANLEITSANPLADPILFVGVALRKASGDLLLVDDALRPLRGLGEKSVPLAAISAPIEVGDSLGLAVYTSHGQYASSTSRQPFVASVSGAIALPLHPEK